ncbi:DNA-packaging protein [Gemmobacter aquarius]|uniref:DNA-packaging protein n=1 Tax=Paragemmobacter aquarius TaxID=2169400 RepID=A0A2S0UM43_9RHOB|nr:head-tail connector protein [Gemmobacter aquarius]AWB48889.1 DNA-packaging protein [Gemmobacter aquarius]
MTAPTLAGLQDHLSFTDDMAGYDVALLEQMLGAATATIERRLGFAVAVQFPAGWPDPLLLAVNMLAAHWYENREVTGAEAREIPFGVADIISDFRDWSF